MVTIAIAAILLAISLPSFQSMIANNTIRTQSNSFIGALKYARSEAMRRGEEVRVCTSNDAQTACDASENWSNGLIVVLKSNLGDPIRVWDAIDRLPDDYETNPSGGTAKKYIEYKSDGRINNGHQAEFELDDTGCTGENVRTIKVKKTGRASATLTSC